MNDPILLFLVVLIVSAITINKAAAGMVKLANDKNWDGWKRSEFAWKLMFSVLVIPCITLIWST